MAATGYTPIYLYYSSSAGNTPSAGNLGNGELAINIADGKLFYKDSGGVVQTIASKSGNVNVSSISFGTTGLTPSTATTGAVTVAGTLATGNGGTGLTSFTANGILYASSTSVLATGSALTFDGTNLLTTGSATAAGFIPSSSTVPINGMYLSAANNVAFATNSTKAAHFDSSQNLNLAIGNLVIGTSGKGIDFSVTNDGTGTTTSELFADYEEGTFSPTVIGTTTAGTVTYNAQVGYYTKIGRVVTYQVYLNWSNGTGAGNVRISGLPYTSANITTNPGAAIGDVENLALTAGYTVVASNLANSTQVQLREVQVGGGGSNPVAYDASAIIRFAGTYYV